MKQGQRKDLSFCLQGNKLANDWRRAWGIAPGDSVTATWSRAGQGLGVDPSVDRPRDCTAAIHRREDGWDAYYQVSSPMARPIPGDKSLTECRNRLAIGKPQGSS